MRVPIKSWCMKPEDGAIQQAKNLANLPFVFKWVSLMPDTHQGYGMPIGGVLATKGVIIPNAVGVDIGCGMCALKTNIKDFDTEILKKVIGEIRQVVPVGFSKHQQRQDSDLLPSPNHYLLGEVCAREYEKAHYSVGTLGGGNHFLELQKDKEGYLWVMIHSGSRNLGKRVAEHYNDLAIKLNEKWHSSVPVDHELAFLPLDSKEGEDYLMEMDYCVHFALANRKLMMKNVQWVLGANFPYATCEPIINIAHNYARMENHFGENVMVHRKGATSAKLGEVGIIPSNMGNDSYIVEGKGNPESFASCSHGAGRAMGRKQAQRSLNLTAEKAALDAKGIIHSVRHVEDLDEAPSSYKNMDIVMAEQQDLVKILVELSPLGVIKG